MPKIHDAKNGKNFLFLCPGCNLPHMISTGTDGWTYNGNADSPTITPSVLVTRDYGDNRRCHSYVTDGKIQFLSDSTHPLANQTVDLPEWDTKWNPR